MHSPHSPQSQSSTALHLPGFSSSPPLLSARHATMGLAALASGACALAGLYPQFDRGELRILIALTSMLCGVLVVWMGLRMRSRMAAIAVTLGVAAVVGIVNTVVPSFVLMRGGPAGDLAMMLIFGVIFGGPTGFAYGVPLAVLVGLVHRPVYGSSFDATDRAKLRATGWTLTIVGFAIAASVVFQQPFFTTLVATLVGAATLVFGVLTAIRWDARSRWTARVREGQVPSLRMRTLSSYDPLELPRLGDGATVIEWMPVRDGELPHGSSYEIYRVSACGVPLAIVADSPRGTG